MRRDIKRILDVSPYCTYPPIKGGQIRIVNLNKEVAKKYHVFQFSQSIRWNELKIPPKSWEIKINNNYVEYRYANIIALSCTVLFGRIFHISLKHTGFVLNILNPKILREQMAVADLIQVESPWQFKWVYKNNKRHMPLILVEHNIEYKLTSDLIHEHKNFLNQKLASRWKDTEKFAVEHADAVIVVSNEDASTISNDFYVDKSNIFIVPNGVSISQFSCSSEVEKQKFKEQLDLGTKKVILFSGSNYGPNIMAVKEIQAISKQMDDENILFVVVGSCGTGCKSYRNLIFTRYVDDVLPYFKAADIAINPMTIGGGTNLKMLEYLASGLPTITTKKGAQGLGLEEGGNVVISEIEDFTWHINNLLDDEEFSKKLEENGRKLVKEKYDWKKIAEKQIMVYEKLLEG